jgi:hypothetical protein
MQTDSSTELNNPVAHNGGYVVSPVDDSKSKKYTFYLKVGALGDFY